LHAEPVFAGSFLVLEDERRGDAAGDYVPGDGDDALGGLGELGEGVWEEIEVVGTAAGKGMLVFLFLLCWFGGLLTRGIGRRPWR
jgi:hypothetical protein